nr:uncharacterized protein LOC103412524 isoform X1 [Malus domestica]
MADSEHSSSDDTFSDSREKSTEKSELQFSEDEEALIIRMYNLVGERLVRFILRLVIILIELYVLTIFRQVGFDCREDSGENSRRN